MHLILLSILGCGEKELDTGTTSTNPTDTGSVTDAMAVQFEYECSNDTGWCSVENSTALLSEESFENYLLEHPQYTKPKDWEGKSPPDILFSGDHAKIKGWRLSQSEAITRRQRPDLWKKYLDKKNEKH